MVTVATIGTYHPEFAAQCTASPDYVQLYLTRATNNLNQCQAGKRYWELLVELTCHYLYQANQQGDAFPAGPASDNVGGVSSTYTTDVKSKEFDQELSATQYGRTFMQIRKTIRPDVVF